jgi:hypothetical protein
MRLARALTIGISLALVAADSPDGTADGGAAPRSDSVWTDDKTEEIVVWGDRFARWDETRWLIKTEVVTPYPFLFMQEKNAAVYVSGFQVEAVMACNKAWKLGRKHYEVDCRLEDVALQASLADRATDGRIATGNSILSELDQKLTGAKLQLQVADDGRVTSIDLEGIGKDTDREQYIQETMRQVLSRVSVGFDMKMQKFNQLHEGKWIEYRSRLMSMPLPANSTATQSNSTVINYLSFYKGQVMVQSIGEGLISVPALGSAAGERWGGFSSASTSTPSGASQGSGGLGSDAPSESKGWGDSTPQSFEVPETNYDTSLVGVSIYDPDEGFMTERVFAVEGKPTASALFNNGTYWHAGRIRILDETEKPSLRMTAIISPRGQPISGLPKWVPIEASVSR